MKNIVMMSVLLTTGCINKNIVVESTKSWEGHYITVEEFKSATDNIVLDKNESIWVMSNSTINRFIRNIESQCK